MRYIYLYISIYFNNHNNNNNNNIFFIIQLKDLSERAEERVNQLTLLLKDAESKASKARDITTRALERLSQVEQTKKTYVKSARIGMMMMIMMKMIFLPISTFLLLFGYS